MKNKFIRLSIGTAMFLALNTSSAIYASENIKPIRNNYYSSESLSSLAISKSINTDLSSKFEPSILQTKSNNKNSILNTRISLVSNSDISTLSAVGVFLDVANFYGYEYESPDGVYWVQAGDEFNFATNVYTKKEETQVYPDRTYIDLWTGSESNIIKIDSNNNILSNDINSNSGLTVNRTQTELVSMKKTNFLVTYAYLTANKHGTTFEGWWTGGYSNCEASWKNSNQTIKVDGLGPTITYSQDSSNWSNNSKTVKISVGDPDSGVKNWEVWTRVNDGEWQRHADNLTSFTFSTDGKHELWVQAFDNVGNSTTKTEIFTIDTIGPAITYSQDSSNWSNGSKTVNISVNDPVSGVKNWEVWTRTDGGQWQRHADNLTSFTFSTEGNHELWVDAYDNFGNSSTKTEIFTIDTIGPTITYSQNSSNWSNASKTVNISVSDTVSGVKNWEVWTRTDDGQWQRHADNLTSFTFSTEGNHELWVDAYDNFGNSSTKTEIFTNGEKYPISAGVALPLDTTYDSSYHDGSHLYKVNDSLYWVRVGGDFNIYSEIYMPKFTNMYPNVNSIMLQGNGSNNVLSYTGNAGVDKNNITATGSEGFSNNFIANPKSKNWYKVSTGGYYYNMMHFNLTAKVDNASYKLFLRGGRSDLNKYCTWKDTGITIKTDGTAPTLKFLNEKTEWQSVPSYTLKWTASDNGSGLKNIGYQIQGSEWKQFLPSPEDITITKEGKTAVSIKAIDNVGNSIVVNTFVAIDRTAPTITLSQNPTSWTSENVTVTANITENGSGINTRKWAAGNQNVSYFANNGTTITLNSFTVTSNGTYTFYVKDNAGNESVKTINITNIDKTAPTITGTFDYPWVKGTRTISFNATDNESGISSLKLWNSAKTKVLKEGTVSNKTASLTHVISEEGVTKYKIEAMDIVNNITTKDVTVRIDNTAPEGVISMPSITSNKTISISFSNLVDVHSGLKEAIISENSSFSGANVVKLSLSEIKSVDDVKSTEFTLTGKPTIEENFTTRTIYIRLYDNVGNFKDYTFNVSLIPKQPDIPVITSPKEDQLYINKEKVILSWTYNSTDEDVGYIPQKRAEIELKHIETDTTKIIEVDGELFNKELNNLDDGEYEVKVRVYNFDTVYSESEVRTFRVNKVKDSGNVLTIDITPGSPIRYVSILTESEIPNGTSIEGKVYYHQKSTGEIDKTQYINFEITNLYTNDNIIKLPEVTDKIKIEYFLKGSNSDKAFSPVLDHLIVLAK